MAWETMTTFFSSLRRWSPRQMEWRLNDAINGQLVLERMLLLEKLGRNQRLEC